VTDARVTRGECPECGQAFGPRGSRLLCPACGFGAEWPPRSQANLPQAEIPRGLLWLCLSLCAVGLAGGIFFGVALTALAWSWWLE